MDFNVDTYLCKNLLYWDEIKVKGYVCTITGKSCSCDSRECRCSAYEVEFEE